MTNFSSIIKYIFTSHFKKIIKFYYPIFHIHSRFRRKIGISDFSTKPTNFYNLDVIISVGYRVKSLQGTRFRQWATQHLKEFIIKGFTMDDERLKDPRQIFGKDYFDEQLERIRDVRSSERRLYQKITDIYAQCSVDYDPNHETSKEFFATVQNMLLYAVTQQTAAELITARANPNDQNFGLWHWTGAQVRKQDILVAKNYLTEDEIDTLNRLVVIFLETAELRTKSRQEIRMAFWQQNVEQILSSNGFTVLTHAGKVSHARMEQQIEPMFIDFDQRRKQQEAIQADSQDEAELKALEVSLKNRSKNNS